LGTGCTCGSTLPTIDAVMGRTLAIFRHPDGRGLLQIVPNSGRDLLDCQFWQMAQVGPNDYEIRYVPRDWGRLGDEPAFSELFRSLFFQDSEIRYKRVREIPLTPAGKLLEYINEYHTGRYGNVR
jgi:phenylacetate-CoA ligase